MRIGLTLNDQLDGEALVSAAVEAERLGLWAVEVSGPPGAEAIRAGRLCAATERIRLVVGFQLGAEHPFTVAEEISVLDNLSAGRIGVIAHGGTEEELGTMAEALAGRPVNRSLLTPPPVQTSIETWTRIAKKPEDLSVTRGQRSPGRAVLSGDLSIDRVAVDQWMAAGCTHLLVEWPGETRQLARHLLTRAAMVDYPDIVSTMADQLAPFD